MSIKRDTLILLLQSVLLGLRYSLAVCFVYMCGLNNWAIELPFGSKVVPLQCKPVLIATSYLFRKERLDDTDDLGDKM